MLLPAVTLATALVGPAGLHMPVHTAQRPGGAPVVMVSTKEVFTNYYEESPAVQKSISTLPPPVAQGAMAGVVAAAAAVGYVLTPSRRLAVNAVGGAITGGVGLLARNRLAEERKSSVLPAVAQALAGDGSGVTAETLAAIAKDYGIDDKTFQAQVAELFLAYLNACIETSTVDTAELSELLRLKQRLSITPAQVGSQVYSSARALYSRHRAYLEEEEDNDSKKVLQKFVFLAERLLSDDESEEGYRYETMRLQKLFNVLAPEWRSLAEDAAVPFYQRALNSAVLEGKPVSKTQLAAVRDSLGITPGCAEGMHIAMYGSRAAKALEDGSGKVSAADKEALDAVTDLLDISPEAAAPSLAALTAPLYRQTAADALLADGASASAASGALALRRQELLLGPSEAVALENEVLRERASELLKSAGEFLKVQNLPQGREMALQMLGFCTDKAALMVGAGSASGSDTEAAAAIFGGISAPGVSSSATVAMYRLVLLNYLDKLKVTADEEASLSLLRSVLGISDEASASVYEAAAGPLFKKTVAAALEGSLSDSERDTLRQSITDLALPAEVTSSFMLESYEAKLRELAGEDGKIINEEQVATLASLRNFLGLEVEQTYAAHEAVCGDAFTKSVGEVMNTAGRIPDEYWEGLEQLRSRLGLAEETANRLYGNRAQSKMKELADDIIKAIEKKAEPKKEENEDSKGEMGITADSVSELCLALVGFCEQAKVLAEVDGVGVATTSLRGELSDRALTEVYRQYLVDAFSGKPEAEAEKLIANSGKLGLVLGLSAGEVSAIQNEIGSRVYRNYLGKVLARGPLGPEEIAFLESIKSTLDMDEAQCEFLVREQQTGRISNMIDAMFDKPQVLAEDSRKMRDLADQFDVDLSKDIDVSSFRLERLFKTELEDLVDTGELMADDLGPLEELMEPLNVSEEKAQKMLTDVVQKRCDGSILQAAALLRADETGECIKVLEDVIKFAALVPVTVTIPAVSSLEKDKLSNLYEASSMTGSSLSADAEEKVDLLKSVLSVKVAA